MPYPDSQLSIVIGCGIAPGSRTESSRLSIRTAVVWCQILTQLSVKILHGTALELGTELPPVQSQTQQPPAQSPEAALKVRSGRLGASLNGCAAGDEGVSPILSCTCLFKWVQAVEDRGAPLFPSVSSRCLFNPTHAVEDTPHPQLYCAGYCKPTSEGFSLMSILELPGILKVDGCLARTPSYSAPDI